MPPSSPSPQISRRGLLAAAGAASVFGLLRFAPEADATAGPQSYSASWASVDQHPPAPQWFQDAKFGIYYHWGVFSVPAFGSEWYPRNMYISGSAENQHHIATYGDPSVWPYNNFIDGARNKAGTFVQFAPKLTSAGGAWDPNAWAQLFKNAGARFAGPVAEHHDGYSMWNSQVNEWNSVGRGPRLDLVGLHAQAIRGQGLKFMTSLHHAYHFNGYYDHVPSQSTATLQKLYGQLGTTAENQLWYNKLVEVINGYQPDLIWQDFDLGLVQESERLNFLATYYNKAVSWNKDVVATYKDGLDNKGEVFDYERGGPGGLLTPYWLTDDAISSSSWGYTVGLSYYTTQALLHALIDRVAKGGNMLLNISPMADGTIPSQQQTILLAIGDWLGRFGEAIYATRSWTSYGEGPTAMGGGSFTGPRAGVPQDVRFTRNQANTVLYATTLGWQGGTTSIATLNSNQFNTSTLVSAQLLGNTAGASINLPKPTQDSSGLHFTMPSGSAPYTALAYVIKLTFSGQIPTLGSAGGNGGIPSGWTKVANVTTGLVIDGGGSVPSGSALKQWVYDGSTNLQWQFTNLGTGYYRITNNTDGLSIDSNGNSTAGAAPLETTWTGATTQQWAVNSLGNGVYQIVNRATGLCLDGGGATSSGSPMKMWPVGGSTNLQWRITTA